MIYTFRGANVGNMADFEREFKVAHVIRLEQNYRSHGNILDAANALIANNRNRLGKNLWTSAGKGEPVRVFEGESDNDEARWIVEEVQALARDGTALSQMAVLYRSNAQSRVVEHALFSQGIPYRVYGGLRFFERAEIKHALAYLRLIAIPEDDSSFLRVANFPPRGIGARTIEQLQDAAKQAAVSLMKAADGARKRRSSRILIEDLRNETQGLPLKEVVEVVIAKSGLVEHYKTEREGADRIENLAELVNAAAAFTEEERVNESGEAVDPLTAFLTHAALEAGEHQAGEGQDALQMMTVHSAKGLEFDVVFMSGLEEGLFPHEQSVTERDGLEEERRLAYVAITRARNRLYLSHAQTRMLHGQTRYNIPSRFLEEIPQQLMKWLTPRFSKQRKGDVAGGRLGGQAEPGVKTGARRRRLPHRAERGARQVRRGRDHRRRGPGNRRAGAGQLRQPGREVARGRRGQAAGRLAQLLVLRGEAPRREARGEAAALAGLALDLEHGVVARERVLGDGEAEAGAAGLARAAAVDAVEALGEPRDVLGLDADAGVLDAEARPVRALAPRERDRAAGRRVADRIAHQVAERARQLALHAEQLALRLAVEPDDVATAGKRGRRPPAGAAAAAAPRCGGRPRLAAPSRARRA